LTWPRVKWFSGMLTAPVVDFVHSQFCSHSVRIRYKETPRGPANPMQAPGHAWQRVYKST
jgi:hypothetical protein